MRLKSIENELITDCQKQQGENCGALEQVNFMVEQNDALQTDESLYVDDLLICSVILFIIFLLVIRTNARHS